MKSRFINLGKGLIVLVCVSTLVYLFVAETGGLPPGMRFALVQPGMTRDQVEWRLGGPSGCYYRLPHLHRNAWQIREPSGEIGLPWHFDYATIYVFFNSDGRVTRKEFQNDPYGEPPFWQRFSSWVASYF